jgi:hypothetical protein
MRVARVEISYVALHDLLKGYTSTFEKRWTNLPDDAKLIQLIVHPEKMNTLILYFESGTFDEVPDGYVIPDFPISVTVQIESLKQHIQAIMGEDR